VILGAGLLALLVPFDLVEFQAGAVALGAPAVLGVEREKPRVELGEAAPARGAGALGGEDALRKVHFHARRSGFLPGLGQTIESRDHLHDALSELQRAGERPADFGLIVRRHAQVGDREFNRVLLEARQAWPLAGGQELAVDAQEFVTLAARPLGQVGVIALAVDDERGEQADALPLYSRKRRAAIASSLCGSIGTLQSGQCWSPSLT